MRLLAFGAVIAVGVVLPPIVDAVTEAITSTSRKLWDKLYGRDSGQVVPYPAPVDDIAASPDPAHTCAICGEIFLDAVETACGHHFCNHCLATWIGTQIINTQSPPNCPMCRTSISPGTIGCSHEVSHMVSKLYPQQLEARRRDFVEAGGKTISDYFSSICFDFADHAELPEDDAQQSEDVAGWLVSGADISQGAGGLDDDGEDDENFDSSQEGEDDSHLHNTGGADQDEDPHHVDAYSLEGHHVPFPWWRGKMTVATAVTRYYGPVVSEQHRKHMEWLIMLDKEGYGDDEYYNGAAEDYLFINLEEQDAAELTPGAYFETDLGFCVYRPDLTVPFSYLRCKEEQGELDNLSQVVSAECMERYRQGIQVL